MKTLGALRFKVLNVLTMTTIMTLLMSMVICVTAISVKAQQNVNQAVFKSILDQHIAKAKQEQLRLANCQSGFQGSVPDLCDYEFFLIDQKNAEFWLNAHNQKIIQALVSAFKTSLKSLKQNSDLTLELKADGNLGMTRSIRLSDWDQYRTQMEKLFIKTKSFTERSRLAQWQASPAYRADGMSDVIAKQFVDFYNKNIDSKKSFQIWMDDINSGYFSQYKLIQNHGIKAELTITIPEEILPYIKTEVSTDPKLLFSGMLEIPSVFIPKNEAALDQLVWKLITKLGVQINGVHLNVIKRMIQLIDQNNITHFTYINLGIPITQAEHYGGTSYLIQHQKSILNTYQLNQDEFKKLKIQTLSYLLNGRIQKNTLNSEICTGEPQFYYYTNGSNVWFAAMTFKNKVPSCVWINTTNLGDAIVVFPEDLKEGNYQLRLFDQYWLLTNYGAGSVFIPENQIPF